MGAGTVFSPVMLAAPNGDTHGPEDRRFSQPLPSLVDWSVAIVVVLAGLFSLLVGSALTFAVDRQLVADAVASGDLEITFLSDPDAVVVGQALAVWSGVGLLVTGVAMVLAAVAYLVITRRARRNAVAGEPGHFFLINAVLGAVVSVLTSFVPFSTVLGGVVAGYLEQEDSGRTISVGAVVGLLSVAPVAVFLVFLFGGLVVGLLDVGTAGVAIVAAVGLLVVLAVVTAIAAGLGALGGYIGGWIAADRET